MSTPLRLGTRGSMLARTQSQVIADALERLHPGLEVELVVRTTAGDQLQDRPLHEAGGKGLFTRELELALLDGEVDLVVHSFKDVPVTQPLVPQDELVIAAVPTREDPRDVLVSTVAPRLDELPRGARIGTGSPRRRCQILAVREDLQVEPIRGNIDTRLRRLIEGRYDAIVLAMAGLRRSGLFDQQIMHAIPFDEMLPAAGQGALALQCRRHDPRTRELLAAIDDSATALCVQAERRMVQHLDGDCHSPIGALARIRDGQIHVRAVVGARGGELPIVSASAERPLGDWKAAVDAAADDLMDQDARSLLAGSSSLGCPTAAER